MRSPGIVRHALGAAGQPFDGCLAPDFCGLEYEARRRFAVMSLGFLAQVFVVGHVLGTDAGQPQAALLHRLGKTLGAVAEAVGQMNFSGDAPESFCFRAGAVCSGSGQMRSCVGR